MKRQLSKDEIEDLIKLDKNQRERLDGHMRESFDKQATLQILNAVSDHLAVTNDNNWSITYYTNTHTDALEFFVEPITNNWPKLPCGRFTIDRVMQRLAL